MELSDTWELSAAKVRAPRWVGHEAKTFWW